VVVAVYEFLDRTGQRSSGDSQLGTSFSTAIGQGSDTYLLRALKRACRGQCFVPVERIGLDHLLKERQLIRSTQQEFGQDPNLPALLFAGVIDMLGIAQNRFVSGGLLIAVGAFQFTRAKEVCHGVCHSPMTYFLGHWKTGFGGGLRMGLGLGAFCVGCCWGFMVLGFVGGVMSLLWMGLATLFMVLEKLPQIGHYVTKPMGFALILAGLAMIGAPLVMGG